MPALPQAQQTLLRFVYISTLAGASGKIVYVYETYAASYTPPPPNAGTTTWTVAQHPTAPVGASYTAGTYNPSS